MDKRHSKGQKRSPNTHEKKISIESGTTFALCESDKGVNKAISQNCRAHDLNSRENFL